MQTTAHAVPATFQPAPRIAISLRLSRSDDASTSLDVQRKACHTSIELAGFDPSTAVEFIDDGVSGATPLADREGMSDLMAYQPTHVWAWKLDRYSRSVREFLQLVEWAETPNKRVILATADGSLNTATPGGRLIALILVALAEWERQMMTERILAAHQERREQGRWISGAAPFPYKITREHPKAPAYLDSDSAMVPLVIKAVGELLAGGNITSTAEMVPVGRHQWRNLLTGVVLRGWRMHKGKLVVQKDGVTPVQFAPEVLDAVTYARLQARLKELANGEKINHAGTPLFADYVWCGKQGCKMSGGVTKEGKQLYKCVNGHVTILAEILHPRIAESFRENFGMERLFTAVHAGGVDHTAALADLESSRQRIMSAIALVDGPSLADLTAKLTDTNTTIQRLKDEHDPEVTTTYVETDTYLFEAWEGGSADKRRAMVADKGLHVVIAPRFTVADRVDLRWGVFGDEYTIAPAGNRRAVRNNPAPKILTPSA
ncbi:recombinase family protein [Streptomyces sp. NPDC056347]|uniref:recombinase family protein n=1 Tax=Streptomyces sp. NPDC056347 TaxID=3345790 RepID=UPI0035D92F96